MGRPSDYSKDLADQICSLLSEGKSLRKICEMEGMPAKGSVFRWIAQDPAFRDQYAKSREMQMEAMAEEILDIADDGTNDFGFKEGDDADGAGAKPVFLSEHFQRSRLRVDTRKWIMSKMAPKKYSDSMRHEGEVTLSISDKLKEARDRAASGS